MYYVKKNKVTTGTMGVNTCYYSLLRDVSLFILPLQSRASLSLTQTSLGSLVFAHYRVIPCSLTPESNKRPGEKLHWGRWIIISWRNKTNAHLRVNWCLTRCPRTSLWERAWRDSEGASSLHNLASLVIAHGFCELRHSPSALLPMFYHRDAFLQK